MEVVETVSLQIRDLGAHTKHLLTFILTYLLTYLLSLCSRFLLEKLTDFTLVKKFYKTQIFITPFTSSRHLSLFWASSIHTTNPHPTSWRSILILSSHLRMSLPCGLFPSGFPTKTLNTPPLSPMHYTCPAHLILLDFITRKLLGDFRSLSFSLCRFLHSPLPRHSQAQVFSSTPYSQTPSAYVPPSMWTPKFHTHTKTKGKAIVLYPFIFTFFDSKLEDKRFCTEL